MQSGNGGFGFTELLFEDGYYVESCRHADSLSHGVVSVIAFHEKAGRSQGNSGFIVVLFFFVEKSFSPAE